MSRKLRVVITDGAKSEVRSIRDIIGRDRPIAAANWVRDFKRHVRMLATIPLGFEIIPEAMKSAVISVMFFSETIGSFTMWLREKSRFLGSFTLPES